VVAELLPKEKKYEPAIADYEKAIGLGAPTDGCECQPDSPLAWLYYEKGQYDKSWEVVHKVQASGRWISPELLEQLKEGLAPRIVEVAAAWSLCRPGVRLVDQKHRRRGDEAEPDPRDPDGTGSSG
jgi:hypothetical protein